jgi:hypothetical protein
MKTKIIFIIMAMGIAFGACNKHKPDKDLHCLTNFCFKDTIILAGNGIPFSNCHKMDGVNVRNVSATQKIKLGDSISINCDAIGLNTSVTGKIMFAIAFSNTTVEVNTFMEYDTCGVSTENLTPMPSLLQFAPPIKGEYNFTFVNIYGDNSKISILVE